MSEPGENREKLADGGEVTARKTMRGGRMGIETQHFDAQGKLEAKWRALGPREVK